MVLEQFKEVNKLIKTPIPNVAAKPLTKFVPNKNNTKQLRRVVIWPSTMDVLALWKPLSIDLVRVLPQYNSSLILSNIRIFASTAIPMLSISPDIPGKVKVTGIKEYMAKLKKPYSTKERTETKPSIL